MLTDRQRRVGELLRAEISDILRREVRDPGLHGLVTVTSVRVSVDLAYAQVHASIYGDEETVAASLAALRRAAPFIRALLRQRLDLRRVPELTFHLDDTAARAQRIESLLRQLQPPAEEAAPEEAAADLPEPPP
jgi:ribosome-binding factor A